MFYAKVGQARSTEDGDPKQDLLSCTFSWWIICKICHCCSLLTLSVRQSSNRWLRWYYECKRWEKLYIVWDNCWFGTDQFHHLGDPSSRGEGKVAGLSLWMNNSWTNLHMATSICIIFFCKYPVHLIPLSMFYWSFSNLKNWDIAAL